MNSDTLRRPISDLRVRQPICVPATTTVREVVRLLQNARTGCVLVTAGGVLAGVFTERDVLRRLAPMAGRGADAPVSHLMTPRPTALHADDSIVFALNQMHVGGYRHIPLVNEANEPVGIISVRDVVDYIVEHFEDTVLGESPTAG
jgi:CBS domain-containing protein